MDARDLPAINVDSLLAIDAIEQAEGKPFRYGKAIYVNLNLENSGTWETLEGGAKLWRLRIRTQGARTTNLNYNEFDIPEGAKYFIYNPNDTSQMIGAFTHNNNKNGGRFATSIVRGSEIILEYYEPAEAKLKGKIEISSIVHGYSGAVGYKNSGEKLFGDSQPCHLNVSCPEADDWSLQVRSVVMITLDTNQRNCTGVLINNVNEDQTPYVLTAQHCLSGVDPPGSWIFYFNYESPLVDSISGCDSTVDGTLDQSILGSSIKADIGATYDSDNLLLLLDESVPLSFNPYFAGWSSDTLAPDSTATIHHPIADVKKFSFDKDPAVEGTSFFTFHWDATFHPDSGTGLVEGGSSGAPLFDHNKRVIGNHSSDNALEDTCGLANQLGRFGNFRASWDLETDTTKQLKYWLDPDTTDTLFIDGFDPNASCCIGNRGDVDGNGTDANVLDLTFLIDYLFRQGPAPGCTEEADMNSDGDVDILDLTYLIDFIFRGGPAPGPC